MLNARQYATDGFCAGFIVVTRVIQIQYFAIKPVLTVLYVVDVYWHHRFLQPTEKLDFLRDPRSRQSAVSADHYQSSTCSRRGLYNNRKNVTPVEP